MILGFGEIDRTMVAAVGGKGAHLGELSRIDGVRVPEGFVVTTGAYRRMLAAAEGLDPLLRELAQATGRDRIRALSAEVRRVIEATAVPGDLAGAIADAVGEGAYAVRSSATAEDLPTASFAGQQDSYLNVVGAGAVVRHVSRCWASLFTERAVTYRLRNGFDHRRVLMAVVVQRMVFPEVSGVLFTADPVTGNRHVTTVDASFGLGEALVSGLVNPDVFRVRDGVVVERALAVKQRAVRPSAAGGTEEVAVDPGQRGLPALTDSQAVRLAALGRTIEAHFGKPQDVEWCLDGDGFQVVQSRPITTLFPIPEAAGPGNRVYLSVGHQQMMTDPMKPLGISMWQLTALAPMFSAGGRLFVDATPRLVTPAGRAGLLELAGKSDPLVGDALQTVFDRDFVPLQPDAPAAPPPLGAGSTDPIATDPGIVAELVRRTEDSLAALKRDIATKSGPALFDFLLDAIEEHKRLLTDPLSMRALTAGMGATWWLNDHLLEWLGERNVADTLTLSAPGNITSEMGLALLDVADVIRPYGEVVAFLGTAGDDFLDELPELAGGAEARDAIRSYLDRYGMRCAGEIDITRPRWSEQPSTLVPLILDNVRSFEPGEAARRFEQGRQRAARKEREVLERLRALPDGEEKARETQQMIDRVRTFIGYREFPKYGIVSRYLVYKQALLAEADRLRLPDREDIYFLTFQELSDAVRDQAVDAALIAARKEEFRSYANLSAPRILTSEGEGISGSYRRDDLPAGALAGVPVSAGTAEGRARVVLDMAQADVSPGDILVTAYTDPSWSPLFVAVSGLVTEVGGVMTHGAVIAREYGLPAVVGVENATRLIPDGAHIRVHGTEGYIEILDDQEPATVAG
ncbi:rifamycin-inactivating phosphotransferase [Paractinoplanes brasiliensis]|uniref:Rifampicin phosphotransferase n=1 Tax=Paractinoplanes brasiliensis TaxID=52695 RepID=A0A4R6JAM3_9ACTN|nr:rifamycin-inactivating phosphotransferase [Actinoplanes brasiliensis]TDO32709.1 pyruvate,water dikinase [Actinoplanes brasiliensis]GID32844.1 putative phosphoenolpyruvate synthase [Actinoplanes brasiliensis]